MGHKVFIPVTDELIFDHPELVSAPLRPYSENLACYHWLDIRLNPQDDAKIAESFSRRHTQFAQNNPKADIKYPQTVAA